MNPREHAAFNAGIAHAASLAQIAAVSIEIRDDASHVRQRAAVAALQALAEGLRGEVRAAVSSAVLNETIASAITSHEPINSRA